MVPTLSVEQLTQVCKKTMVEHLGIVFLEVEEGRVLATMPIDKRTCQTMGRLHGGASLALAESVGGAGSMALIDNACTAVVGVDINGTHVGTTAEKAVFAEAKILFKGKSTHVWEIRISDKHGVLISVCRLTNRLISLRPKA